MSKIEVNQISSQCGSTLTIGQSGDTVTLAAGATQSGFGRTGTVDWCTTAKTAPFTGVSGKGYFVNTTCGAVTVTLPATPTAGDIISIKDYARTAGTNAINFCRNGSKMDGDCASSGISTNGESVTLIYVDGTKGWTSILDNTTAKYGTAYVNATGGTIVTCGDYKTHIFTSDGCFSVSNAGNPAGSNTVDYLVVAGGGGGGATRPCGSGTGGAGAGGFRTSNYYTLPVASPLANPTNLPVSVGSYPITIGAGAAGVGPQPSDYISGLNGSPSSFSSITSAGGGGGSGGNAQIAPGYAGNGGSGGGGGYNSAPPCTALGNTPPVSPPQGNPGGSNSPATNQPYAAAGGGGAGAAGGTSPTCNVGGSGGIGSYVSNAFISPTCSPSYGTPGPVCGARYFAGGGGGGGGLIVPTPAPSTGGPGGSGGGGAGAGNPSPGGIGTNGTVNTGGGGGGNVGNTAVGGTSGGSGIVIIRYKFQN